MVTAAWEPKDRRLADDPTPSRQIEPHPAGEKNLSRIFTYLTAEFGGQAWRRDPPRTEPVVYFSTSGPRGRHFVGITKDFLREYESKDVVAALAGRGLIERLRKAAGRRQIVVTKGGFREMRLEAADEPPPPSGRPRGRPPGHGPRRARRRVLGTFGS